MNRYKSYISSLLVMILLCSTLFISVPRTTHAIPVLDIPDIVENVITAVQEILSLIIEVYMKIKDTVLDPLAWIVSKVEINLESTKILQGIQGGGGGGRREGGDTLFVHDWKNFTDVPRTDELTFFQKELEGSSKVNPAFKDALTSSFNNIGKQEDDIFRNLNSTFDTDFNGSLGDFYKDFNFTDNSGGDKTGWDAWNSMVTSPGDNPYLSFVELSDARNARVSKAEEAVKNEALSGQGFLGNQDCEPRQSNETDDVMSSAQDCDTTRPGVTVGTDLSQVLQQPITTLGYADELSEILSSAISQLTGSLRTKGVASKNGNTGPGKPNVTEERNRTFQESKDNALNEAKRAEERVNEAINLIDTVWHIKAKSLEAIDEVEPGVIFSLGRIIDLNTKEPLGKCISFPDIYESAGNSLYDVLRRKEGLEREVGFPVYASEMGTTRDPWNPGPHDHLQPVGTLEPGGKVSQELSAAHADLVFLRKILENPDEIPSDKVSPDLRYMFEKPSPDGDMQSSEERFREARRRTDVMIGALESLIIQVPQAEVADAQYKRIIGERNTTDSDWRRCYQ
jgi:hypothetical protein